MTGSVGAGTCFARWDGDDRVISIVWDNGCECNWKFPTMSLSKLLLGIICANNIRQHRLEDVQTSLFEKAMGMAIL